jgi:hypothetical protein
MVGLFMTPLSLNRGARFKVQSITEVDFVSSIRGLP